MNNRFRNAAIAFIALAMAATAGMSSGVAAGTDVLAQATPADTASPADSPTPADTAAPAATAGPVATMAPAPTPDANGITPVKQGGTTENSNGANWLQKFNRNPGPDTSGANAPLDVPIRNGPGKMTKKAPKVKVKKLKSKPPA